MMQQVDYACSSQFVHLCPSPSDRDPSRGLVSIPLGVGGGGFESPCYLTASPPIPLPIYGGGAINAYVRSVPNCLPSPFWQSLHLMEISVVFIWWEMFVYGAADPPSVVLSKLCRYFFPVAGNIGTWKTMCTGTKGSGINNNEHTGFSTNLRRHRITIHVVLNIQQ